MTKCSWCNKTVEGEIMRTPTYHPKCRGLMGEYLSAAAGLQAACGRVPLASAQIESVEPIVENRLNNVKDALDKAVKLQMRCS